MLLFKEIIIALTLLGSVSPAVINLPTSPERRAVQSCHATDEPLWTNYSVWIGVPYIGPSDCDDTYSALDNNVGVDGWQCVESGGGIQLWFSVMAVGASAVGQGATINSVLESRYPTVNSFNCPDQ
jgi:hypothetical protein